MRDTIDMAREAGFELDCVSLEWHKRIEAFEALVRADEREACARVCDEFAAHYWAKDDAVESVIYEECAAAIRARGETK